VAQDKERKEGHSVEILQRTAAARTMQQQNVAGNENKVRGEKNSKRETAQFINGN